jgi:hypothetical protein
MTICIDIHCNPILQNLTINPGIRHWPEANNEKLHHNFISVRSCQSTLSIYCIRAIFINEP